MICKLILIISPLNLGAVVVVDLQLPVQSVPITTEGVSSNSAHGEVYSIGTPISSTNKTDYTI
jgi:hypothetical protein